MLHMNRNKVILVVTKAEKVLANGEDNHLRYATPKLKSATKIFI